MLVCLFLISPLLNFMADKVDSLVTPDVRGGPVCCASSTLCLAQLLGWVFCNVFTCCDTDINGISVRVAYASKARSWSNSPTVWGSQ